MNNEEQIMLMLRKMSNDIASVKTNINSVKADVDFVRAAVVKIEYEQGTKLQALIEGQVALEERFDTFEQRLTQLEKKVDRHEAEIASLWRKAK